MSAIAVCWACRSCYILLKGLGAQRYSAEQLSTVPMWAHCQSVSSILFFFGMQAVSSRDCLIQISVISWMTQAVCSGPYMECTKEKTSLQHWYTLPSSWEPFWIQMGTSVEPVPRQWKHQSVSSAGAHLQEACFSEERLDPYRWNCLPSGLCT